MSRTRFVVSVLASLELAGAMLAGTTLMSTPAFADVLNAPGPAVPAVADLNHDGYPDVVFSDFALGNGVSVFLGRPGGGFQPAVRYATGAQADYVAIADFNHDGKLDLAVTNFTSSDVSILMGNGDGTFVKAVNYPTDLAPGAVVVGDLNHDGKLDLATSNQAPSMSVLLGHGDGTFAKAVDYSSNLGVGSGSADAADFDGDGNLDLLRGNYVNSTIQIYRGRGDGTFNAPTTFSEGATTAWYGKARDINGDGKPDILFSNLATGTVSTLFNKGDGTFGPPKAYPTGGLLPQCFDLADLNGDGKLDMVVANGGTSSIDVLLGTGGGTFGQPHTYPSGGLVPLSTPILADFNGDGKSTPSSVTPARETSPCAMATVTAPSVRPSTTRPDRPRQAPAEAGACDLAQDVRNFACHSTRSCSACGFCSSSPRWPRSGFSAGGSSIRPGVICWW